MAAVKMKKATGKATGIASGGGRGEAEGNTDSSGGADRTGRDGKTSANSPLQDNRQLSEMNASLDQRRASLEEMVMGMTPQQVDDLVHAKVKAAGGGE
mmetsp:Transcript_103022/g.295449  ORF Transcript_103022/g.295449 Transcript_103022/m.295449 type:complete len:98 (-) Transcript_103022:1808-2101(-)